MISIFCEVQTAQAVLPRDIQAILISRKQQKPMSDQP